MKTFPLAYRFVSLLALSLTLGLGACDASQRNGLGIGVDDGQVACGHPLVPVTPDPVVGVGPMALDGLDSDDNGISDRNEWGDFELSALDTDHDGTPDYQDEDDDNDGVLDVYDAARLVPAAVAEQLQGGSLFLARASTATATDDLPGTALAGKPLTLHGSGFTCEAIVILRGDDSVVNLRPTRASARALTVTPPANVVITEVRVFVGGLVSNSTAIKLADANTPALAMPANLSGEVGARLRLSGVNLQLVETVNFGTTAAVPLAVTPTSLQVVIPMGDATDRPVITVSTDLGLTSNAVPFSTSRPVPVQVGPAMPPAFAQPLQLISGLGDVTPLQAGAGTLSVPAARSSIATVVTTDADGAMHPTLSAWVLPEDTAVAMDANTTAIVMAADITHAIAQTPPQFHSDLRQKIAALPTVQALGQTILAALASPAGLVSTEPTLVADLVTAGEAVQLLVDTPRVAAGVVANDTAVITPRSHDISIEQIPGSGNVVIKNNNALYISAQMTRMRDDKGLAGHIKHAFDKAIVDPQSGWSFSPGSKQFNNPDYDDLQVEIITSGLSAATGLTPDAAKARYYLTVRNLVSQMLAPLMDLTIDIPVDPGLLLNAIVKSVPNVMEQMKAAVDGGSIADAYTLLMVSLTQDQNAARFHDILVNDVLGGIAADVAKKLAIKVASRFVPLIGQLAAVLDALGKAEKAIYIGIAIKDLNGLPAKLDFDVLFGLSITKISPQKIDRKLLGRTIEISGVGFGPYVDEAGSLHIPRVTFRDLNAGGNAVFSANPKVPLDQTRLRVDLPDSFVATALGPIEVRVVHGDQNAIAPKPLEFGTFELTELMPKHGKTGQEMTLTGLSFETQTERITVIFSDEGFKNVIRVPGTRFSAWSETEIKFPVPDLPGNRIWDVKVTQGPVGSELSSKTLPYYDAAFIFADSPTAGRGGDTASLLLEELPDYPGYKFEVFFRQPDGSMTTPVAHASQNVVKGRDGITGSLGIVIPEGEGLWEIFVRLTGPGGMPEESNARQFSYVSGNPFEFVELGKQNATQRVHATFVNESGLVGTRGSTLRFGAVWAPGFIQPVMGQWLNDVAPADGVNDLFTPLTTYDVGYGVGGGEVLTITTAGDMAGRAAYISGSKLFYRTTVWPVGARQPIDAQADLAAALEAAVAAQFPGKKNGISASGQLVGMNDSGDMIFDYAYRYNYRTKSALIFPSGVKDINGNMFPHLGHRVQAINNSSQVIGFILDEEIANLRHPVIWDLQGTPTPLTIPNAYDSLGSRAYAINDAGDVGGSLAKKTGGSSRPSIWTASGEVIDLLDRTDWEAGGPLGGRVIGLNNRGEAVGVISDKGRYHPFLYLPKDAYGLKAGMHDMRDVIGNGRVAGHLRRGETINDAGMIIAHDQSNRAYLIVPSSASAAHGAARLYR